MHKQLFSSVPQSSRSKYFRIFPEKTWWSPFLVNLQRKLTQKVLKDVSLVGLRKFIPLPINSSKSRANVSYSTKGNSITNSSNIFLNPFRSCKSTHLIQFMFSEREREEERGKKRERVDYICLQRMFIPKILENLYPTLLPYKSTNQPPFLKIFTKNVQHSQQLRMHLKVTQNPC